MKSHNERLSISRERYETWSMLENACEDLVRNAGRQVATRDMPQRLVEEDDFQRVCSLIGADAPV